MLNIIIGIIIGVLLVLTWLIYEVVTAPLMPDDYDDRMGDMKKEKKDKDNKTLLLNKHDRDPNWDKLK